MVVMGLIIKGPGKIEPNRQFYTFIENINDRNYDVMYYGNQVELPEELEARRLTQLSSDYIDAAPAGTHYVGKFIIINDPKGEVYLSAEHWKMLFKLYNENTNVIIAYIGTTQFQAMQTAGFDIDTYSIPDLSQCHGIVYGKSISYTAADNAELLPYAIEKELPMDQRYFYRLITNVGHTPGLYFGR